MARYRAVDLVFDLDVVGDGCDAFEAALAPLLEADGVATTAFMVCSRGDRGTLTEAGRTLADGPEHALLQALITRLGEELSGPDVTPCVHASTVASGDGAVMLTAPSGYGKTTMTIQLLRAGLRLVAEDVTGLDEQTLDARPYHRPLGILPQTVELLGLEGLDGQGYEGKLVIPATQFGFALAGPTAIRVAAICDRRSKVITEISPAAALARLLELGVAPHPDPARHLGVLAGVLARARCVELGTADLEAARGAVTNALEGPVPAPVPVLVEVDHGHVRVFLDHECVLVAPDRRAHHLNASATQILLWHLEGEAVAEIAVALDLPESTVRAVVDEVGDRRSESG